MNTKIISALTLVMLFSLSGCKKTKLTPKETTVAQLGTVSIPLAQDKIHSFYDDDIQEFMLIDDTDDLEAACNGDDLMKDFLKEEEYEEFAWTIEDAVDPIADELQVIYFDFDGSSIRKGEKEKLDKNVKALKKVLAENENSGKKATVVVEGHSCHAAGSRVYNQFLSEKRAGGITNALVAEGLACTNVKTVGRGCEIPAVVDGKEISGNREEQWANRRCEISVIKA